MKFSESMGFGVGAGESGAQVGGLETGFLKRFGMALLCGAALLLAGCGDSGPDMKAEFSSRLPNGWQLESFKVEAKEEVGSKVEPQFHYRFRAEVSPASDLYRKLGTLDGTDVLQIVRKKGDEAPVLGTARALFKADKWETAFSNAQAPDFGVGRPAAAFAPKQAIQGSADFRRLLKEAKAGLEQRTEHIEKQEAARQQGMAEWNALREQLREEAKLHSETYASGQKRLSEAQNAQRSQARVQLQEIDKAAQAELQTKAQAAKQALDTQLAELDKQQRLQVAELRARRSELQQAQNARRKQLHDAHNAEIASARQRLGQADFIRHRAMAEEGLRTGLAAVDAEFGERQTQLRNQEGALSAERREQAAKLNVAYQEQIAAIRQPLDEARNSRRAEVNRQSEEGIKQLDAELRTLREQFRAQENASRDRLAAKRRDVDRLAAGVRESRRQLAQTQRLIEQLEQPQG